MTCTDNSFCGNLCCKFCNTEGCVFRCYSAHSTCGYFKTKKIKELPTFDRANFIPVTAPKGTKFLEKPDTKTFKEKFLTAFSSSKEIGTFPYKYSEEVYQEMLDIQKNNTPQNCYKDSTKKEIIEKLNKYDTKFSTVSDKETLRVLLVDLEETNAPLKKVDEEPVKKRGRQPKIVEPKKVEEVVVVKKRGRPKKTK
jgi:hypothetical protein